MKSTTKTQTQSPEEKPRRHNAPWTVTETLRMLREYELLQLSVEEIAALHNRSVESIVRRLEAEGLALGDGTLEKTPETA